MILHIATDEKFIDAAFRVFEKVKPGENKLIIVTSEDELNFVKKSPFEGRTINELRSKEFTEYLQEFSAIILHSLSFFNINFPINVKVLWIGFGFDYYDLIYSKRSSLLMPKTIELNRSLNRKSSLKKLVKLIPFSKKLYALIRGNRSKLKVINEIHFFAPVLKSEYESVANVVNSLRPDFIDWNYGTLEDDHIKGFEDKRVFGNNILIGNSASYENNHLEAFDLLRECNIKGRDLVCPLSYGDSKYQNKVCRAASHIFGERFNALTRFMPIDEYIKILSSCSVVIMNHIRQQALGNIITMLYLGSTVFLRDENPIYKFLISEGVKIFSIQDLEINCDLIDYQICDEELKVNRNILNKHWSREVIEEKTRLLINEIQM